MIKRVVYVVDYPFSKRDFDRFGAGVISGCGFIVEIWDLSRVIYPLHVVDPERQLFDGLKVFKDKPSFMQAVLSLVKSDFVIPIISYGPDSLWVYRGISRSKALYAVFAANTLPAISHGSPGIFLKKLKALLQTNPLKRILSIALGRLPIGCVGVRPADFILAGGRKSISYTPPASTSSSVISAHALDYDIALQIRGETERIIDNPYIVFLDEFPPFSPDLIYAGYSPEEFADSYYAIQREFFERIERITGKAVVIAAHPRSDYEQRPDYYGGRKIVKGETARLVRDSEAVLLHCSTSLNFAVIFRKPLFFHFNPVLDKIYEFERLVANHLSAFFGKAPLELEGDYKIDLESALRMDKGLYDDYMAEYIKSPDTPEKQFWLIVADELKKL